MQHSNNIVFIPCTKDKIWDKYPHLKNIEAVRAYNGKEFKLALKIAKKLANRIIIFSAKYGFMDLNEKIPDYYDVTFSRSNDPYISEEELKSQAQDKNLFSYHSAYVLCAKPYVKRIQSVYADKTISIISPTFDCINTDELCKKLGEFDQSLE